MKKLLALLALIICFSSEAQPPTGTPQLMPYTWYQYKWGYFSEGVIFGDKLPNFTPRFNGTVIYNNTDKTFHYYNGTAWAEFIASTKTYSNPTWLTSLPWIKITSTPTTLSGYGITDAVPSARTITINGTTYDLSANRTWTIDLSSIPGTGLTTNRIPYWTGTGLANSIIAHSSGNATFNGHILSSSISNHIGTLGGQDFEYVALNSGNSVLGKHPGLPGSNGLSTVSETGINIWAGGSTSNAVINFLTGGTSGTTHKRWTISSAGHFIAGTDNSYDIGASGANRPRDFYLARNATITGNINFTVDDASDIGSPTVGAKTVYTRLLRSPNGANLNILSSADVLASVGNARYWQVIGGTNLIRLNPDNMTIMLGGTTNSYPMLVRNSTNVLIQDATGGTGSGFGVGVSSLTASTIGEFASTTKGVLIPRMTTSQQDAVSSPATGLLITNTDHKAVKRYDGSKWRVNGDNILFDHYIDATNSGTSETDLYSDAIPANILSATGEKLVAEYSGTMSNVGTSNVLKLYFAGTVLYSNNLVGLTGNWQINVTIYRTGSNTVRCVTKAWDEVNIYTIHTDIGSVTFSNTNILKLTGTNDVAGSSMTAKTGFVKWLPAVNAN